MILWTNLHVVFKFVYHEPYRFGNKCTNKANNCFPCFLYICITPEQINIGKIWSVHKPYIKKERQYNGQQKKDKQWFTKHCTKAIKNNNRNPAKTPRMNSCAPEEWAVLVPLVTHVVLLLLQIRWLVMIVENIEVYQK